MKKLLLVTDAWRPQVNGVVTTYEQIVKRLSSREIQVVVIEPSLFFTIPLPFYPELRLALFSKRKIRKIVERERPDYIHIATEGTLGWSTRAVCQSAKFTYTTAYHTHFQRHLDSRMRGFIWLANYFLGRFHKGSSKVLVATHELKEECEAIGIQNIAVWPLGVDTDVFYPREVPHDLTKPVFLFFSRLATEKSPDEFFELPLEGTKLVIGDGPERRRLEKKYPDAVFVGYKHGEELTQWLSRADVLVFPSRTETFGLVMLEALACGVPVAAHNTHGPADIVTDGVDGYLGENLAEAAEKCLSLDRVHCRGKALRYSWDVSADIFVSNLALFSDTRNMHMR